MGMHRSLAPLARSLAALVKHARSPITPFPHAHHSPNLLQALTDAIEAAGERDVLFISTAGNLGLDLDAVPRYPASLRLPNMLVVASSG